MRKDGPARYWPQTFETRIGTDKRTNRVTIDFNKPVGRLALKPQFALEFAQVLSEKANELLK